MNYIQTLHGNNFYFEGEDTKNNILDIREIASALSKICRYNGHCHRFYSVAEHSIHVSKRVSKKNAMWGLLHDAAEAYIGDITTELKQKLSKFIEIEKSISKQIGSVFNLDDLTPTIYKDIKNADIRMLATEKLQLMSRYKQVEWPCLQNIKPYDDLVLSYLEPTEGEAKFLSRFYEIKNA